MPGLHPIDTFAYARRPMPHRTAPNTSVERVNNPRQNHLLAALPVTDYEKLRPELDLVDLPLGLAVYEAGDRLRYVYFPTTAIISLLCDMEDGASAEVAISGNDGLVGTECFMGGAKTYGRAIVQSAGYAYRIKGSVLKIEFNLDGELRNLALRYTLALITQMSQMVVCNRHHTLEQRFCRLLLQSMDRSPMNELTMTHELIAKLLGVRREGVTEAAGHLQKAGVIHYSRGNIAVIDRAALEKRACECYDSVEREVAKLLPLNEPG